MFYAKILFFQRLMWEDSKKGKYSGKHNKQTNKQTNNNNNNNYNNNFEIYTEWKKDENRHMYSEFTWDLSFEHESDGDTNCN